jgi:hypothetical protein
MDNFTADQLTVISNALRVAEEHFKENVRNLQEITSMNTGHLVAQFNKQAKEARAIYDYVSKTYEIQS